MNRFRREPDFELAVDAIGGVLALAVRGSLVAADAQLRECFEQAIRYLIANMSAVAVRAYICAEPGVDTALRLCFSCSAPEVDQSSWLEGLESQISHLRAASGALLVD